MNKYRILYVLSAACFAVFAVSSVLHYHTLGGWALFAALILLAFAVRGHAILSRFTYTISILAAVCIAMYHPEYFITIGNFKFSSLTIPLLQIIMFGMGTELSWNDFAEVMKTPKTVIIGLIAQFTIMPTLGYLLATGFQFPAEIAAGVILIGCSPSGLASNVMSYLAKANLALSVCITSMATLLAPFFTPMLMKLLGGTFIAINFWNMVWDISKIVLIPIAAGVLFNYLLHGKFKWLDKAMPYLSMGGIMLIIMIIIASGRNSLLEVGITLLFAVLLHNIGGFLVGYWLAKLMRFDEKDCRTISIEVGMQNGGLASGIALNLGKMATVGLAPAIFSSLMNVTGSTLASWWHYKVPQGHKEAEERKAAAEAVP
ncbi:MAG TPA: bile acid:sodium symporter family protein [Phnomibacter sp.]|nr:bile acid:sodium symporter family protein [Phnomibacter sp.]